MSEVVRFRYGDVNQGGNAEDIFRAAMRAGLSLKARKEIVDASYEWDSVGEIGMRRVVRYRDVDDHFHKFPNGVPSDEGSYHRCRVCPIGLGIITDGGQECLPTDGYGVMSAFRAINQDERWAVPFGNQPIELADQEEMAEPITTLYEDIVIAINEFIRGWDDGRILIDELPRWFGVSATVGEGVVPSESTT